MTWRFAAAKTRGTLHFRHELPCQDAYSCELVDSVDGPVLVAVVSDGAGSASEGGAGSQLICAELSQLLIDALKATDLPLTPEVVTSCVIETRDRLVATADAAELPVREFAATVLCSVVAEGWSAFAQVGDGAIVASEPGTSEWAWLFWPHRGEYANTTSFLSDPSALEQLQVEVTSSGLSEIAMFTDGIQHLVLEYESQTVHSAFFERMMTPVRRSTADGEDSELSLKLGNYLGSAVVTDRADDDLTLVLATKLTDSEPGATTA